VLIVGLSTKGIFVKEEEPTTYKLQFASEYQELMWLAEKQRYTPSAEETRRFYQLRHSWPDMHAFKMA